MTIQCPINLFLTEESIKTSFTKDRYVCGLELLFFLVLWLALMVSTKSTRKCLEFSTITVLCTTNSIKKQSKLNYLKIKWCLLYGYSNKVILKIFPEEQPVSFKSKKCTVVQNWHISHWFICCAEHNSNQT